jgi:hypothetical protein
MATKKESRWQNQGKKKVLVTKVIRPNSPGKSEKARQSEKGSEEGAGPASIAKWRTFAAVSQSRNPNNSYRVHCERRPHQ